VWSSPKLVWISRKLIWDGAGEECLLAAGVFGGDGFDERDPGLFGRRGFVANAAGNDEELARSNQNVAAIGFGAADAQLAAEYEEHFVLKGVRVPGEVPVDTRYLDELIIDLTNDSRRPELRERAAREFQRYRMRGHRRLIHGRN
jgi:hypothetical protein